MRSLVLAVVSLSIVACTGDDISYSPVDGGRYDATPFDSPAPMDAGASDANDSSAPIVQRLLMAYEATSGTGEAVAFDPVKYTVDGRLPFQGFGAVQGDQDVPYLLESKADTLARLDPAHPWLATSTWSVHGTDAFDGGEDYADPVAVLAVAPNKAYVFRYNRDAIAVVDPSQTSDGGAAQSYIDLESLQQAGDHDGHVDVAGAIYDPTRKRVYVALANIDIHLVDPQGYFQLCGTTTSSVIAIDTTTDTLVSLGGTQPGGGIALNGHSPQLAPFGVAYDVVGDRMLIMSTGCNPVLGDGGTGALLGRLVEAVSLKTNTTTTLLDLDAQQFPGEFLYVDQHTAYVQIGFPPYAQVFAWDPTTTALGPALPDAPDVFAYDSKGNALIGPQTPLLSDGGTGPVQVVSVPLGDGGPTNVLLVNPFTSPGGFIANAALWPPK